MDSFRQKDDDKTFFLHILCATVLYIHPPRSKPLLKYEVINIIIL